MNLFLEAYHVLSRVYSEGAHLKIAFGELPHGEHGRTVKLCYGVLENDGYLSACIKSVAEKSPKAPVRLVMKLALYAMLFGGVPREAATNEAVELLKEIGKGGTAGFVNAALRNFQAENVRIPEGNLGLQVRSNYPAFAVEEIVARYGARAEGILLAKSHGVSIRFCRNMQDYLAFEHEDTPFESVKLFKNFTRDDGFFRGDYTFQSVGSVAICAIVEPCENFLDACAAPGGKSVLLSDKCERITACELHEHRVSLIESYIKRMNVKNVVPVCRDSAEFYAPYEEAFDGVLVDAPCSGLGTVSENPDLPLRKNEGGMSELNALQLKILRNCARYVKRGGTLYYSTCSILDSENDGTVGAFLKEHGAFRAESIQSPLVHEITRFGLQFLPDTAFGAGFYIAKLRKS